MLDSYLGPLSWDPECSTAIVHVVSLFANVDPVYSRQAERATEIPESNTSCARSARLHWRCRAGEDDGQRVLEATSDPHLFVLEPGLAEDNCRSPSLDLEPSKDVCFRAGKAQKSLVDGDLRKRLPSSIRNDTRQSDGRRKRIRTSGLLVDEPCARCQSAERGCI